MKYLRNGFYFGILLLMLLATACQMGAATPTPAAPALINSKLPSVPNAAVAGLAPQLQPLCSPPVPSISNINSFCANQTSKLGGATWDQNPSDSDPSVAKDAAFINNFSANPDCSWNQTKVACSGPQDAKVTYELCTSCGAPNSVEPQGYDATYGPNVCSSGYVKINNGACAPVDPNKPYYGMCPSGSHYDNVLQNCADDVTHKLASPCPPGYPYYLPDLRLCVAKAYAIVYDCQDFTVTLGECPVIKKIPGTGNQCPAGKTYKCTKNPLTGAQVCSCQ